MWKKLDKNCEPEQYRKSESNQSTKNGILQLYGQHDWRGKVFGWSSHHSGQMLSIDQL